MSGMNFTGETRSIFTMRKLLLSILLMTPALVQAGPWCLVRDENERCNFLTADDCYVDALAAGGTCRPNYRDPAVIGARPWCVISATTRWCNYYSQQPCLDAARKMNGGCVPNTEQKIAQSSLKNKAAGFGDVAADICKGDLACEAKLAGSAMESMGP
jgi:hypothetical protein